MRRMVPVIALVLALAVAGCVSLGADGSSAESPENVSVEYAIESGGIPEDFESATVTMQIVFVETADDFSRNSCWRSTYLGPHKPTPTPIATPSGDCHSSEQISVDLTDLNETHTLEDTVPGRFDAGHGLVVTNLTATYQNGTSVTAIKGIGGHRSSIVQGRPNGPYDVELAIEPVEAVEYDYRLVSETTVATRETDSR